VTVLRGGNVKMKVAVERTGGFAGPIELIAANLPKGVTANSVTVAATQTTGELTFQADKTAPVTSVPLVITGRASGVPALPAAIGLAAASVEKSLRTEAAPTYLSVGIPTPFKIVDEYVMTSAPRGEMYRRKYRVERDPGFAGPIEVRLADRQARHLQGVTGPVLVVPADKSEFEYPAYLPPWMELGRTCRVCVMAVGKVRDADGTEHSVAFSSVGQNQQMIVVVGPGRLDVAVETLTVRAVPGGAVRVPVKVTRDRNLSGPVTVTAVLPAHWRGVTVSPVAIPADQATGELVVRFAAGECGPFNMPLVVRATLETKATPVVAEAELELVK
jgi:hypothetical protein